MAPYTTIAFTHTLADGTIWSFMPKFHLQRPGLLLSHGSIYVAFGSTADISPDLSRGSIARFDARTLRFQGSEVIDQLDRLNPVRSRNSKLLSCGQFYDRFNKW